MPRPHHERLPDVGRVTHRQIDAQLPSRPEKRTLRNIVANAELELIASGNTGFDQDDNWRIRIDGSGNLVIECRVSGTWTAQATWTP
jgi:hypothetical protein